MAKFNKINVAEMLGILPISRVTDREIWSILVTPQVKALLGPIVSSQVELLERQAGAFPGDEVSNLNDHRLYGGQRGFVRYPYIKSTYITRYGAFIVKRDGVKVEALGWVGDVQKGVAELVYKIALRDRRFDGTLRANDTALVDFPYDDPSLNAPLTVDAKSVELSTYGYLPGSLVGPTIGDRDYEKFVANPFSFLDRPELFRQYFDRAWKSHRAPGQIGAPIPDVSKLVPPLFEKIAAKYGYDFIESAPSHYHVAMWAKSAGYRFTNPEQARVMAELAAGIKRIKDSGIKLTRPQESWVCVVQSLRPIELIPEGLYLGGPVWPQDNIGPQNLWMNKPLNERAAKLIP